MRRFNILSNMSSGQTHRTTSISVYSLLRFGRADLKLLLIALLTLLIWGPIQQAPAEAALIDGIKAYYDFNETSGTSLPLVQGTGNDGVLNNMDNSDWVAGQASFGNALDFDGSNDFVHIVDGYTNTINGDDTHTVSMWVNPRSVSNNPLLLDAEDGGTHSYFLELGSGNPAYVANGGSFRTYTGSALALNNWHHFAFVKTGAGNNGDLYIDGVKLTAFSGAVTNMQTFTSDFLLGNYRSGSFNIDGLLDDLAIWDRDLSEAEVLSIFNSGAELAEAFAPAPAPIPEPSSILLLGVGTLGLARFRRERNRIRKTWLR